MSERKLFSEAYKAMCEDLHEREMLWGRGPALVMPDIFDFLREYKCDFITDYGCGKGMLPRVANHPIYNWQLYDPMVPEFAGEPRPLPYLVCADVLEHIEPEYLENVLIHIGEITDKIAFLSVCTEEAKGSFPDGRNVHLIVEDYVWWFNQISKYFRIVRMRRGSTYVNFHAIPYKERPEKW